MIPKFPSSYIIPAEIQREIDALVSDLDLVLVSKSFVPFPDTIVVRSLRGASCPYPRLPYVKPRTLCACYTRRYNVHKSNNNYPRLPISWD